MEGIAQSSFKEEQPFQTGGEYFSEDKSILIGNRKRFR
jgi:hypothetical protein